MFKATILTSKNILYDGNAWSVFMTGSTGEFEILELHKDIISLLKKGRIVIDWKKTIPIRKGIVRIRNDELVAVVEE